jgi:type IV secretion system protein VirD4
MAQIVRRILGLGFDGKPIYAPKESHSLLLAAAGGGKTTCGAVPWIQSLLAYDSRALVIADSKEGEIAAQCAPMCAKYGRKVAIVDNFSVLESVFGSDNQFRISLNPLGAVIASYVKDKGELVFSAENATQALIEEPPRDQKNAYWREEPRTLIEFATCTLLVRNVKLATPGGIWSILSDPGLLRQIAEVEAEEGDEYLRALALHVLGMMQNEEHFPQHRAAAMKALRIYSAKSALHRAGVDATHSHERLIRDKYVVFLVGPVRHMERLGADYALHLQSFMEVVLGGGAGPVSFILDEFTNAPLRALVSQLTTMRGYGGTCHMIAQSRSEIQRKYGDKETATIEEMAVVKQYFGFSSYEEAERLSRAMGETRNVSHGLGLQANEFGLSRNFSTGKERLFTADELMRLPPDEQIIHVKDVGFVHCRKIRQNENAPYCHDLAPNPLEGGVLPPTPKVTLPTANRSAP